MPRGSRRGNALLIVRSREAQRKPHAAVRSSAKSGSPCYLQAMATREVTNADIAEWLAIEAADAEGTTRMAMKRAARMAFLWPEEARDILKAGRSLTELAGVGAFLERRIRERIEAPPRRKPIPEERRQFLTMSQANAILQRQPQWRRAYRGDLQMHSRWSDGSGSIADMAEAGRARGYQFIAITDHSKGLKIAGGIDERKLRQQAAEIEQVNGSLDGTLRVLRSIELNLNPSGQGDMDPDALAELDLVVGSFHSALRQKADQTARYLAAIENPHVHILGHPRGRIFNYRLGLSADWRQVFARAAELDKAIEVDSYPDRQDINLDLLAIAREEGVRIAIDTDAHAPEQLGFAALGLAAALKARISRDRIVNFLPVEKLLGWAAEVRVKSIETVGA